MNVFRTLIEIASEPWCLLDGHRWVKLKNGQWWCKRCGKKSPNPE